MKRILLEVALVAALTSAPAMAQDRPTPTLQHNTNSIWFDNWIGLSDALLKVAAPDGTVERIQQDSGTPTYRLAGARIADGAYHYELRAATTERILNPLPIGIDGKEPEKTVARRISLSGAFWVLDGRIEIRPLEASRSE